MAVRYFPNQSPPRSASTAGSVIGGPERGEEVESRPIKGKERLKKIIKGGVSKKTKPKKPKVINLVENSPKNIITIQNFVNLVNEISGNTGAQSKRSNGKNSPSVEVIEKTLKRGEVVTEVVIKDREVISNKNGETSIIPTSSTTDISITVGPSREQDARIQIKPGGKMDIKFSNGIIEDFLQLRKQSSSLKREVGGYLNKSDARVNFSKTIMGTPMMCPLVPTPGIGSFHTHPYCQQKYLKDNYFVFTFPSTGDIIHYFKEPYARSGRIHFVIDALGYFVMVINIPKDLNTVPGFKDFVLKYFENFHNDALLKLQNTVGDVYQVDPIFTNESGAQLPDLLFFKYPGKSKLTRITKTRVKRDEFRNRVNTFIQNHYMNQTITIDESERNLVKEPTFPVTYLIQHFEYYLYKDAPPSLQNISII